MKDLLERDGDTIPDFCSSGSYYLGREEVERAKDVFLAVFVEYPPGGTLWLAFHLREVVEIGD